MEHFTDIMLEVKILNAQQEADVAALYEPAPLINTDTDSTQSSKPGAGIRSNTHRKYIVRGKEEEHAKPLKTRLMFYNQLIALRQQVALLPDDLGDVKCVSKTLLRITLSFLLRNDWEEERALTEHYCG